MYSETKSHLSACLYYVCPTSEGITFEVEYGRLATENCSNSRKLFDPTKWLFNTILKNYFENQNSNLYGEYFCPSQGIKYR